MLSPSCVCVRERENALSAGSLAFLASAWQNIASGSSSCQIFLLRKYRYYCAWSVQLPRGQTRTTSCQWPDKVETSMAKISWGLFVLIKGGLSLANFPSFIFFSWLLELFGLGQIWIISARLSRHLVAEKTSLNLSLEAAAEMSYLSSVCQYTNSGLFPTAA